MMNKLLFILLFCCSVNSVIAGTTGKIVGKVSDAENGQSLPMVNVLIEGTTMGAASDMSGNFIILSVPPGIYTVRASMLGYKQLRIENVRVSIDLTTEVNFELGSEVLAGEEVTVVAERPMITKDLTATTAVVGAEEIAALPVTEVNEAIELQAGLIKDAGGGFHIRGGRSGEVSYWIDGIPVTDVYDGGAVVDVNKDMVQELQVVSGAFNAEYGQAMSGIVNIATKGGTNEFGGNFTTYIGDHLSNHKKKFMHIDHFNPISIHNFDGSIHGSILKDKLFYYANARYIDFEGWIYGQRRFMPNTIAGEIVGFPKNLLQTLAPEYLAQSKPYSESNSNLVNYLYILGTNNKLDSLFVYEELISRRVSADKIDSLQALYTGQIKENYKNAKGDGKYVPMNWNRKIYAQGKLIYKPSPDMNFAYSYIFDNVDYQEWGIDNERNYKYNPDGAPKKFRTGYTHLLNFTHLLTARTFYNFGFSYFSKNYEKYVYKDPYDPHYVHPILGVQSQYFYKTGGTDNSRFERETQTFLGKFDITSQITNTHQIKAGAEFRRHDLFHRDVTLQPTTERQGFDYLTDSPFIPTQIYPDSSLYSSQYRYHPIEFSAFIQDKMEFRNMIVNFGIRFDYFEPDGTVLSDETDPDIYNPRKPENQFYDYGIDGIPNSYDADGSEGDGEQQAGEQSITLTERQKYWYKNATAKYNFSPRIGVSFPITERGVIHFSYGHFFQIPRFERLYQNPEFQLSPNPGNQGVIGNADLKPEQTINGEIGLQQQLSDDITLDVTGYFRDIRDLAGTRAQEITIFGGSTSYSKIINSDFGFVRGIIISLNKRFSGGLSASADYTLQQAKGTNSNPEQARNALAGGKLPEVQLTPLDWDQQHTVNTTISYSGKSWGGSLIAQYGSGLPYSPRASQDISTLLTNSQRKPNYFNVDLKTYKEFKTSWGTFTLFTRLFNLFDQLNELNVFDDSGTATYTVDQQRAEKTNRPELINTFEDWFTNPTHFSEPRRIELGVTFDF